MRSGPHQFPKAKVLWEEVFTWARDIEEKWGYYLSVVVNAPLPSQRKVRFVVSITGRKMRVGDPQMNSTILKYRNVQHEDLTAEQVALSMLVELHRKLDNDEYEAERATLSSGALF
jgi:hypothetical protein